MKRGGKQGEKEYELFVVSLCDSVSAKRRFKGSSCEGEIDCVCLCGGWLVGSSAVSLCELSCSREGGKKGYRSA